MRQTGWVQWAVEKSKEELEDEELIRLLGKEPPQKPFSTPPGWVPPTMGEQFRYAARRHPYYRYGYAAAVLVGLIGWGIATEEKKHEGHAAHAGKGGDGAAGGSK